MIPSNSLFNKLILLLLSHPDGINTELLSIYCADILNSKLFIKDFDKVVSFSLKRILNKYESKISNVFGLLVVTYIKAAPSLFYI